MFSSEFQVTNETSRALIGLSDNDRVFVPKNSLKFFLSCNDNGISVSIHIYPTCGHI